uniref:Uncharacterized protein n=1 Tax=Arundo donax TaxID=35708 RepID=A0A0A9FTB9_ARUDO
MLQRWHSSGATLEVLLVQGKQTCKRTLPQMSRYMCNS